MGWTNYPNINDSNVVCQTPCKHTDCAYWRTEHICPLCNKKLLPGDAYYLEDGAFVHAVCREEKEEHGK